ncbi:conserved hypothetical protein; putative exported protein [Cupriavidus taiwanensis]|nr:conserved hypothetical protein; putative exported protein [Cupriavidus taiwanensis]SPA31828.1 conserved hypothetical protein; putative exported protein [Cupriavidus taiwanensis]
MARPIPHMSLKPSLLLAAACVAGTAPALAGYNIWTGEYSLTRQELQTELDKRFPATLRYAEVVSVRLSHPRLVLDEASNRITTHVDARLTNTLLPAPPVDGKLALNSGVRYDPARRAVLLDNPTVQQVDVTGMAQYREQLNAIGAVVAQQLLKDYPIYTFKPEELRVGGKEVEPGAITVGKDEVRVEVKQR